MRQSSALVISLNSSEIGDKWGKTIVDINLHNILNFVFKFVSAIIDFIVYFCVYLFYFDCRQSLKWIKLYTCMSVLPKKLF